MDIRGWAHVFDRERYDAVIDGLYLIAVGGLTTRSIGYRKKNQREYHRWLEERILTSIRDRDRDLFARIVGWNRQFIDLTANASEEARGGR